VDQYLAVQVALEGWEKTEAAKQKQAEAGRQRAAAARAKKVLETNRSQVLPAPATAPRAPQVRKQIAAATGASERKVQQALNVQKNENAERRHLSVDQYLAVQVALEGWEATEAAKLRQLEAGKQQGERGKEGGRGHKKPLPINRSEGVSAPPAQPKAPDVRKQIATATGASEHKVQQAITLQRVAPELLQQVAHGKVTLREAAKKVATATPPAKPAFAHVRLTGIR
jgi:hypothetical protein